MFVRNDSVFLDLKKIILEKLSVNGHVSQIQLGLRNKPRVLGHKCSHSGAGSGQTTQEIRWR